MTPRHLALALLAVSLVSAGCLKSAAPSASLSPAASAAGASNATASASGLVGVEKFKGATMGGGADTPARPVCANPSAPVNQDHVVDVPVAKNASAARVEVTYKPTVPVSQLRVLLYDGDPADGGKKVGDKIGASPVVIDLDAAPLKGLSALTLVAFVCNGADPSLPFDGAASYFAGPVPQGYSAIKG